MSHLDDVVDGPDRLAPLNEIGVDRIWAMLESAPDGMLMTDARGLILAVNQQIEQLFGYDRADLLGREVEILLPESFRRVHRAHRTRYVAAPNVRSMGEGMELWARRADGSEFPVEVSLSPLSDADGFAVVASVRDISARRLLEGHTRRIQAAIDATHDGVFVFEPDTLRFVYANQGASEQVGYSTDELLDMTPLHVTPEFTREQFTSMIAPLIAGDVDHLAFRTVHRTKSGRDVPVEIVLEHRREGDRGDREGSSALLVAVVRDVTEQVAVERRLARSEETFRTSFEQAPVGMTISRVGDDGSHVFERVNAAFAEMLGRDVDELVGTEFLDVVHPEDRSTGQLATDEMQRGERNELTTEKRYLRRDGTLIWALRHGVVIERADGLRVLSHVVDITDRREREAERERMNLMEDRERIARDIHDLVIQRLFGAGMKLQAVIPEMGSAAAVRRTHETVDDLDAAIRELRSAIFSLQRDPHARSITDAVESTIEQHVDLLGFRPTLRIDGPVESLASAHASELVATLREALSNIGRHAAASRGQVHVAIEDSSLELTVADDGRGIDPDGPQGNGLRNMRDRAVRHGGAFRIDSPQSGGCELTWTIPR